jgi:hypothetical protein
MGGRFELDCSEFDPFSEFITPSPLGIYKEEGREWKKKKEKNGTPNRAAYEQQCGKKGQYVRIVSLEERKIRREEAPTDSLTSRQVASRTMSCVGFPVLTHPHPPV